MFSENNILNPRGSQSPTQAQTKDTEQEYGDFKFSTTKEEIWSSKSPNNKNKRKRQAKSPELKEKPTQIQRNKDTRKQIDTI